MVSGTQIRHTGEASPHQDAVLTDAAIAFVADLQRRFGPVREELLRVRIEEKSRIDAGGALDFLADTSTLRAAEWSVSVAPHDLRDRRVEITGPTDRKMIINALNSGARVFMADFEDSNAPTWENMIEGQANLRDAVRRTITFAGPEGREYRLNDEVATLMVRPRGWHLVEKHMVVEERPVAASFFDFGLYIFHNAAALHQR